MSLAVVLILAGSLLALFALAALTGKGLKRMSSHYPEPPPAGHIRIGLLEQHEAERQKRLRRALRRHEKALKRQDRKAA